MTYSFYQTSINNLNYTSLISFYQLYDIDIILPTLLCQLFHLTYKTLFLNHLEAKVTIKPANETSKACKSNISQNFFDVYSIFMIIIQTKVDCK